MSITKEEAIEKAKKVLIDINFWSSSVVKPNAKLVQGDDMKYFSYKDRAFWLISFVYAEEDFGEGVAKVFIDIDAETGEVDPSLTNRSGSVKIRFDEKHNKYVRVK